MMKLPKARTENLREQNLGKETLIYDSSINKALNLSKTLSVVGRPCNGKLTLKIGKMLTQPFADPGYQTDRPNKKTLRST